MGKSTVEVRLEKLHSELKEICVGVGHLQLEMWPPSLSLSSDRALLVASLSPAQRVAMVNPARCMLSIINPRMYVGEE